MTSFGPDALPDLDSLDDAQLSAAWAPPRPDWLRLNFVTTVDGAVTGRDGLSKSIQNAQDQRVFEALRADADVIVVGAGTVRAEAYQPNPQPFVVVSRSGSVPESLRAGSLDRVHLATVADNPQLGEARALLGDRVWVLGEQSVDLTALRQRLRDTGFGHVLCEGGPRLAHDLLAAGLVDELCLTVVPRLLSGEHRRLLAGTDLDVRLELAGMWTADSTLLQRWFVKR